MSRGNGDVVAISFLLLVLGAVHLVSSHLSTIRCAAEVLAQSKAFVSMPVRTPTYKKNVKQRLAVLALMLREADERCVRSADYKQTVCRL